jgi:integrase
MGVYKYTGKKGYYIDTLEEHFTGIISGLIPRKAGTDPGFHFHDLQHTFASHQKMAGTDDCTHMDIMGHSDHRMIRRYAHLTPEHKRKAVNALPAWKAEKGGQNLVRNSGLQEKASEAGIPQVIEIGRK